MAAELRTAILNVVKIFWSAENLILLWSYSKIIGKVKVGILILITKHTVFNTTIPSGLYRLHNDKNKSNFKITALGLFTQCCHALRKIRQKREYKDLMSLVRDKSVDDYDPANEDPNLSAKLEENKMIAKANEEEILEK